MGARQLLEGSVRSTLCGGCPRHATGRCGLGGRALVAVLDLAPEPLHEHARFRELALALHQLAFQGLLRLAAPTDLAVEVLDLLLQLLVLLAQACDLAGELRLAVVFGRGGRGLRRATSEEGRQLLLGTRCGHQEQVEAERPRSGERGFIPEPSRPFLQWGRGPAPRRRGGFLGQGAVDRPPGSLFPLRPLHEVGEYPLAPLGLGAHARVAEAARVRQLDETRRVEEAVEDPPQPRASEAPEDLPLDLVHAGRPGSKSLQDKKFLAWISMPRRPYYSIHEAALLGGVMILGLGIDLVETGRMAKALGRHGERFQERIFTPRERADCAGRVDRVQALAARFAAKEACLKALGTGWAEGLSFRQVEVVRGANGRPTLKLDGPAATRAREMGVRRVHVSLTHQAGVAAAVVILEE